MALSVQVKKGESKLAVSTKQLNVGLSCGLSWDGIAGRKTDLDLFVAAAEMVGTTYMLPSMEYLVYHANLKTPGGEINHSGDEQSGAAEGDDEKIIGFLNKLPANINEVVIGACVDPKKSPGMTFADVANATLKVRTVTEGQSDAVEVLHTVLSTFTQNGVILGKFTKGNDGWVFSNLEKPLHCVSDAPIQELLEAMSFDCL